MESTENSTYYPVIRDELLFEDESLNEIDVDEQPQFFQAFEFVDIVKKLKKPNEEEPMVSDTENTEQNTENTSKPEPSDEIINCISEFLGCIESHPDLPREELSSKAKNCYQLFQDCSGSVILIPDLYRNSK